MKPSTGPGGAGAPSRSKTTEPPEQAADVSKTIFEREDRVRESQADTLIRLVDAADVHAWRTPGQDLYVTLIDNGRAEHFPVKSSHFRRWLRLQFYIAHEKAVRNEAISDAIGVLEGRAMLGSEHEIYTRVAGFEGRIYIDLADCERRIVEIDKRGWRIVTEAPVRFRRPAGTLPLPTPVRGGSVDDLRPLINVPDDDAWVLLVGYLLGALHPDGPYLVMVILGEKGTAKSTATRILVMLLDPKDAPLRRPPRGERDLAIATRHGWVIALNNVSSLTPLLSDAISSIATEGGFVTRSLFTDDGEARFKDRRPVILNGIPDFVTRGDLADRSAKLTLARISDHDRREEADILSEFARLQPQVLGALYDAVACALERSDSVILDRSPRMADAARWITAAEPALGWRHGRFLAAFERALNESNAAVVESDAIALAVREFATSDDWRGSATELLRELSKRNQDESKLSDWPTSPQGLASALRRCAPELRSVGVLAVQDERADSSRRTKLWTIRRIAADGEVDA